VGGSDDQISVEEKTMNVENAFAEITDSLASGNEWLLVHSSGNAFALLRTEIEITCERGRILFGFTDDKGFQTGRVGGYKIEQEKLTLDLTGNFGRAPANPACAARLRR
jgi:hypothetical protein